MPTTECDFSELKNAYRILGVPPSASALSIRRAYRRIAKRWHPDLYQAGTPAHDEATQMMALINDAYTLIESAPLLSPRNSSRYPETSNKTHPPPYHYWDMRMMRLDKLLVADRFSFWVRFVFGAFFGVLMSLRLILKSYDTSGTFIASAFIVLGCALASAKYGDRFWNKEL
jgi:preprotein translocase subunit Sec63